MTTLPELADSTLGSDLILTVSGREVRVPAPPAREGLRLRRVVRDHELTTDAELEEIVRVMPAGLVDVLTLDEFVHVGRTALMHFGLNARAGELFWRFGVAGEAIAAALPGPVPVGATSGRVR